MQEPDDDRGQEDYRERALQKITRFFPQKQQHALEAGHAVVGQLHHKGHRLAAEDRFIHDQSGDDANQNAQHIQRDHHQRAVLGKKRGGEEGVNRDLGRTAHVGRQQDGHLAVAVGGYCAGGHDGRHRAAKANQHGHDAAARQADLAQRLVHHKGHARHIARILQNGQEEKQRYDDGQEGQHAAHARENAVDNQAVHHGVNAIGGQPLVNQAGQRIDAQPQIIGQTLADDVEGKIKGQQHHAQEGGNGSIATRKNPVDAHGARMLLAFMAFYHGSSHHTLNEGIAHIGQGGVAIQSCFVFHLHDAVLQQLLLVLIQLQFLRQVVAALNQLGCAEARGNAQLFGMIINQVNHRVDAAVHG